MRKTYINEWKFDTIYLLPNLLYGITMDWTDVFLLVIRKKNWLTAEKKTIGKTADKRRNKFEKLKWQRKSTLTFGYNKQKIEETILWK